MIAPRTPDNTLQITRWGVATPEGSTWRANSSNVTTSTSFNELRCRPYGRRLKNVRDLEVIRLSRSAVCPGKTQPSVWVLPKCNRHWAELVSGRRIMRIEEVGRSGDRPGSDVEAIAGGRAPMFLSDYVVREFRIPAHHRVRGVTEQLAQRLKVAPVSEELARERAPKVVGGNVSFPDAGARRGALNDLVDPLPTQRPPRISGKHGILQMQVCGDEITAQPTHRLHTEREYPFVLALFEYADASFGQINVANAKADQSGHSHARVQDEKEHDQVAESFEAAPVRRLEHRDALLGRRCPHRFLADEWLAEPVEWVGTRVRAFADQECEEALAHRPVSENRLRRQGVPAVAMLAKRTKVLRYVTSLDAPWIRYASSREMRDDSEPPITVPIECPRTQASGLAVGKVTLEPRGEVELHRRWKFGRRPWFSRSMSPNATWWIKDVGHGDPLSVEGKVRGG